VVAGFEVIIGGRFWGDHRGFMTLALQLARAARAALPLSPTCRPDEPDSPDLTSSRKKADRAARPPVGTKRVGRHASP
jgi:hypothetical protein